MDGQFAFLGQLIHRRSVHLQVWRRFNDCQPLGCHPSLLQACPLARRVTSRNLLQAGRLCQVPILIFHSPRSGPLLRHFPTVSGRYPSDRAIGLISGFAPSAGPPHHRSAADTAQAHVVTQHAQTRVTPCPVELLGNPFFSSPFSLPVLFFLREPLKIQILRFFHDSQDRWHGLSSPWRQAGKPVSPNSISGLHGFRMNF